jgi:hypothetical protein
MRYLVFLLLVSTALAQPEIRKAEPVVKGGLVCRTKQQDLELRDWIAGIQNLAQKAISEAKRAKASEADVQGKLYLASQDGIKLAKERDQAILDRDHLLKKLHFLKFGISAIVTLLIIFVMLRLGIPPPLSLYIGGAAIIAANVAIWTFL